jgi:hypothetical protein
VNADIEELLKNPGKAIKDAEQRKQMLQRLVDEVKIPLENGLFQKAVDNMNAAQKKQVELDLVGIFRESTELLPTDKDKQDVRLIQGKFTGIETDSNVQKTKRPVRMRGLVI